MARSRRGFQLQQFLPGNIVPSTASKPTGVVPENPMSLGSMKNPAFSAGSLGTPAQQLQSGSAKLNLAGGQMLIPQASSAPVSSGSKWTDLQKALGGINMGGLKPTTAAGMYLGADAATTDWSKLLTQGSLNPTIAAALKTLGISKPSGSFGTSVGFGQDWLKSMGLV